MHLFKALLISLPVYLFTNNLLAQEVEPAPVSGGLPKERLRVELNAGMGQLMFKNDPDWNEFQKEYGKRIRGGTCLDGSITYFPVESFGIGVKAGTFYANHKVGSLKIPVTDSTYTIGDISDNIKLLFCGLNLVYRKRSVEIPGNAFYFSTAIGYTIYNNYGSMVVPIKLSGMAPGFCFGVGYDLLITRYLSVGVGANLWTAVLKEVDFSDGTKSETLKLDRRSGNLLRGTLTAGFRYTL